MVFCRGEEEVRKKTRKNSLKAGVLEQWKGKGNLMGSSFVSWSQDYGMGHA